MFELRLNRHPHTIHKTDGIYAKQYLFSKTNKQINRTKTKEQTQTNKQTKANKQNREPNLL